MKRETNRLSRVSLLTNLFTTFSRSMLSVHSLWNFRNARELNLAGNIVDCSQFFKLLANENILSAVVLVAGLTATSLMTLITLGIKIKSLVGRFGICLEAVVRRCSVKKVFLACNFIKKETLAQVLSCKFCEISKNNFFYRTPPVAVSVFCLTFSKIFIVNIAFNI